MAILTGTTVSSVYRPRRFVSAPTTTTAVQPPDWQSQFDQLGQQYQDAMSQLNYYSPPSEPATTLPSLSLSTPLSPELIDSWFGAAPEPVEPAAPTSSSSTSTYSGRAGISAYGYSGTTGVKGTKGPARYGLQEAMWSALSSAFAAMAKAGLGVPTITDGWRSYATQVDLKRRKPKLAATPGRSIHGLGYAVDIDLTGKQLAWLRKNGAAYGLIAPVKGESWHWQLDPRKVGKGDPSGYGRSEYEGMAKVKPAGFGLHPKLYESIQMANADMAANGLGTVKVTSGHRTEREQKDLYKKQPDLSAPPGQSVHQLSPSPAVDIDGTPKQLAWLRDNARKYSLLPSSEPWHFSIMPEVVR